MTPKGVTKKLLARDKMFINNMTLIELAWWKVCKWYQWYQMCNHKGYWRESITEDMSCITVHIN